MLALVAVTSALLPSAGQLSRHSPLQRVHRRKLQITHSGILCRTSCVCCLIKPLKWQAQENLQASVGDDDDATRDGAMNSALLTIQVPEVDGIAAGTILRVNTPNGCRLEVPVPEGVTAGMTFQVPLPRHESLSVDIVTKYDQVCASKAYASRAANEFDVWWLERRARHTVSQSGQAPKAPPPGDTLQLNVESVRLVLNEFVRSNYCREICNHHRVEPTDYGQIAGIFESVRLVDDKLVVKLKHVFNGNPAMLDRLGKYARGRIPSIVRLEAITRDGRASYS